MIVATLFVYGHKKQVNWGDHVFLQLPSPNDVIHVIAYDGGHHYAQVRHTEYTAASAHQDNPAPSAIVVTDWRSFYPADDAGD